MSQSTTRPRSRVSLAVAVVAFVAGLLFATSASVFASRDSAGPRDLRGLVAEEAARLEQRNVEVEELRSEVAALQESFHAGPVAQFPSQALENGTEPVVGPGVVVSLSDAPASSTSDNPDDLVVHQQDLQGVVNALWAGGAEAIAIQGQRVVSTTAVRCIGNVLLLHGRTYSPPYVIEAIGDPDLLTEALADDAAVELYLRYVEAFDMGWSVHESDDLALPAYTGARTLNYASALEETQ